MIFDINLLWKSNVGTFWRAVKAKSNKYFSSKNLLSVIPCPQNFTNVRETLWVKNTKNKPRVVIIARSSLGRQYAVLLVGKKGYRITVKRNGILLPKLLLRIVRINCFSDREKVL